VKARVFLLVFSLFLLASCSSCGKKDVSKNSQFVNNPDLLTIVDVEVSDVDDSDAVEYYNGTIYEDGEEDIPEGLPECRF